jgi:hypothetical protein
MYNLSKLGQFKNYKLLETDVWENEQSIAQIMAYLKDDCFEKLYIKVTTGNKIQHLQITDFSIYNPEITLDLLIDKFSSLTNIKYNIIDRFDNGFFTFKFDNNIIIYGNSFADILKILGLYMPLPSCVIEDYTEEYITLNNLPEDKWKTFVKEHSEFIVNLTKYGFNKERKQQFYKFIREQSTIINKEIPSNNPEQILINVYNILEEIKSLLLKK